MYQRNGTFRLASGWPERGSTKKPWCHICRPDVVPRVSREESPARDPPCDVGPLRLAHTCRADGTHPVLRTLHSPAQGVYTKPRMHADKRHIKSFSIEQSVERAGPAGRAVRADRYTPVDVAPDGLGFSIHRKVSVQIGVASISPPILTNPAARSDSTRARPSGFSETTTTSTPRAARVPAHSRHETRSGLRSPAHNPSKHQDLVYLFIGPANPNAQMSALHRVSDQHRLDHTGACSVQLDAAHRPL